MLPVDLLRHSNILPAVGPGAETSLNVDFYLNNKVMGQDPYEVYIVAIWHSLWCILRNFLFEGVRDSRQEASDQRPAGARKGARRSPAGAGFVRFGRKFGL